MLFYISKQYITFAINISNANIYNVMALSKDLKEKILEKTSNGFQTRVAKQSGKSRQLVCSFFKGKSNNKDIEKAVVKCFIEEVKQNTRTRLQVERLLNG